MERAEKITQRRERKTDGEKSREYLSSCIWPLLWDRNTALQVLPNGIDHYKNASFRLGKQRSRRTFKYHDSVVEVNIAWEKHIIIILSGCLKTAAFFRGFSFAQKWAETKELWVQLPITQACVCLIGITEGWKYLFVSLIMLTVKHSSYWMLSGHGKVMKLWALLPSTPLLAILPATFSAEV